MFLVAERVEEGSQGGERGFLVFLSEGGGRSNVWRVDSPGS